MAKQQDEGVPEGYKRCSKGDECIHPEGPVLPATRQYFYGNTTGRNGLAAACTVCSRKRETERRCTKGIIPRRYTATVDNKKLCTCCGKWKPATLEYFSRHKNAADGLRSYCKICAKEKAHQYYIHNQNKCIESSQRYNSKHREERFEYKRRYRIKARKIIQEYQRQYYTRNSKTLLKRKHQWYSQNQEHCANYRLKWRENNPLKIRATRHIRRAREHDLPDDFTAEDWQRALDYFDNCCAVCGRPPGLWHTLATDHWIALSDEREDNPGTVPWNIVPLCHSMPDIPAGEPCCNNSKYNKDPEVWLREQYSECKAQEIEQRIADYFEWVKCTR